MWLDRPVEQGAAVAGAWSMATTPGALIALSVALERRRPKLREDFLAILLGDPMLGGALAGVVAATRISYVGRDTHAVGAGVAAGMLALGLVQWISEHRRGYYSRLQLLAPTKIYHQLVVYPLLGYWFGISLARDAISPMRPLATLSLTLALLGFIGWVVTLSYDRRHPKLAHVPFEWRRMAPAPSPWPWSTSVSVLHNGPHHTTSGGALGPQTRLETK